MDERLSLRLTALAARIRVLPDDCMNLSDARHGRER
jgi:hypothetical protein